MSLFRLFGRREKRPTPLSEPTSTADGWRLYVFADVHGCLDLFERMRTAIARDLERSPAAQCGVIGLGDAIDRGPDSKGVVEALRTGFPGCATTILRGNHEQMLLDFLEDPVLHGPVWFGNGAAEALASYGVDAGVGEHSSANEFRAIRDQFARQLPPAHNLFLQKLPLSHQSGSYFFSHAGARPGTPLDEQDAEDLLWFRNNSTHDDPPFEKMVVHGHTPVDKPYFGKFRINLDTGAYFTNRLTCLMLEGARRELLEF